MPWSGVRGKSIVDLRHLTLEKHKIFNEILLEGILEENGMANFSSILTEQEVNHVHNYIIDRATKDRITEKNK